MSCFEYNYKLHVSVVFFHHHFILYDAIQSPHGLQSTWEVNCFDIIDRIKIIPDYLKKNWKTWTVFCQVVNGFLEWNLGFFFQELIYLKESHFTSLFMLTSDLFDLFSLLMKLNTFIYTEIKDCCLYWSFFILNFTCRW